MYNNISFNKANIKKKSVTINWNSCIVYNDGYLVFNKMFSKNNDIGMDYLTLTLCKLFDRNDTIYSLSTITDYYKIYQEIRGNLLDYQNALYYSSNHDLFILDIKNTVSELDDMYKTGELQSLINYYIVSHQYKATAIFKRKDIVEKDIFATLDWNTFKELDYSEDVWPLDVIYENNLIGQIEIENPYLDKELKSLYTKTKQDMVKYINKYIKENEDLYLLENVLSIGDYTQTNDYVVNGKNPKNLKTYNGEIAHLDLNAEKLNAKKAIDDSTFLNMGIVNPL